MKISIVTIYDAYNYGCFLQAFSTYTFLEELGYDVTILDCFDISYKMKLILSKKIKDIIDKFNKYKCYKKDWKLLKTERNKNQAFDCIICGSDEIWSINQPKYKNIPEFYGNKLNTSKLIAYAPSCGSATFEESISDKKLVEGIKRFDYVFPRDELTKNISEAVRNNVCYRVVDPTILLLNKWDAIIDKVEESLEIPIDIKEKYIVYYSYYDNPKCKKNLIDFAKVNNLKIISPNFKRDWCDISLDMSPLEFLYLIKNSEYVVTTTFHGTIFANIFKKNYIVESEGQKVLDFLSLIDVVNLKLYKENMSNLEFSNMLKFNLDYNDIFEKLNIEREKSEKLLIQSIEK